LGETSTLPEKPYFVSSFLAKVLILIIVVIIVIKEFYLKQENDYPSIAYFRPEVQATLWWADF